MANASQHIIRGGEALPLPYLHHDEEIILQGRKHRLFLITSLALPSILFVLSLVAGAMAATLTLLGTGYIAGISDWALLVPLAGVLVSVIWLALAYTDWANHQLTLTNKRIIIEQQTWHLFEERSEALLSEITEVQTRAPEPIAKLLGYAHLSIESAGGRLIFPHLGSAQEVKNIIHQVKERANGTES